VTLAGSTAALSVSNMLEGGVTVVLGVGVMAVTVSVGGGRNNDASMLPSAPPGGMA